ncbi:hypothetical protein ACIA5H_23535 [Nocardia sp. NPDC051900]|uniref:hypothetical protein n=1 Tax=Nocardia sp. NPDC051900 TaxID=3364326 RepID=UPI0037894C2C
MGKLFTIEIEPEVRDWLQALPARHFLKIDEYVGLLAEQAESLGEPSRDTLATGSENCVRRWMELQSVSPTGLLQGGERSY